MSDPHGPPTDPDDGGDGTDYGGEASDSSVPMMRCSRCERSFPVAQAIEAPVGYQCPDCARGAVPARRLGDALNHAAVTRALVYVIGAVFILSMVVGEINQLFGLRPILVAPGGPEFLDLVAGWYSASSLGLIIGEPWRLITSGFLHANFMHIGFNGLLLWQLGHMLEPYLGSRRFIALYAAGLAGGSFGVVLLGWLGSLIGDTGGIFESVLGGNPFQITIGASGAVFGLMGAAMVGLKGRGINPWQTSIGALVLLNLGLTFFVPNISVGGHIGGLLAGWIAARFLFVAREKASRATRIVGVLTVALLIGAVGISGLTLQSLGW